mmetsp:Transcript_165875/g.527383  ORF Transcript_165875/g.527383 Transcript_165875/m.527383 type:complete len:460 (-) Transcript_165875:602-1981(-)
MIPAHHVVAGPHGAQAVRAREESTCQHEGSYRRGPEELALNTGHVVVEAVDVVNVAVLDVVAGRMALVQVVARHRDLGAVEDAGLVHVVPGVKLRPAVRVHFGLEEGRPKSPSLRVAEVWIEGGAWPAKALVVGAIERTCQQTGVPHLREDCVVLVTFQVRINDRHYFAPALLEGVEHRTRIRKVGRIPGEVSFPISVLQVQPQKVEGDLMPVEALVDGQGILHIDVIPPGLVLPEGCHWRKAGPARHRVVLPEHHFGRRPHETEKVQHARLEEPPGVGAAVVAVGGRRDVSGAVHLHEALRRVRDEETRGRHTSCILGQMVHCGDHGHVAIESHGHIDLILEDIEIEEPIWLLEARSGQVQPRRMLSEPHEHRRSLESHIDGGCGGAAGLAVVEVAKGLVPEVTGVYVSCIHYRASSSGVGLLRAVLLEIQQVPCIEALQQPTASPKPGLEWTVIKVQ